MSRFMEGLYFSPDDGAGDGNGADEKPDEKPGKADAPKWETWHDALTEPAQKLIAEHTSGLKTALKTERDARKDAEKDLRAVAADLEKGSDAQKKVLELADAEAAANTKADFYDDAHKNGVTNLKLAYIVAKDEGLFDKRGNVNFGRMKENFPELFGKKKPPDGSAGEGTGGGLPGEKQDMNAAIRKMAGRS